MTEVLLTDYDMSADFPEDIEVDLMSNNEFPEYFSLGACYRGVTGTKNGVLYIYARNYGFDEYDYVLIGTLNITAADNKWDKYQFVVSQHPYRNLLLKYAHNGITGGKLSIDLYKKDM